MIDRFLHPCPSCNRHVADEPACPFCGAELPALPSHRATLPGRFSRAAVFAGATLAGCWTSGSEPKTTREVVEHHDRDVKHVDDSKHDDTRHADTGGHVQPARIEGMLIDTTSGQPAPNIQIHLSNGNPSSERVESTGIDGRYAFDNVVPGSYTLTWGPNDPRKNRSVLRTTVSEGARVQLDLKVSFPPPNNSNIPMPYGAPPARYRVV